MAKRKTLVDRLRAEIIAAGKRGITRYRIAKLSGVAEGQLSRIMQGGAPRLDTAERIARAIGKKIEIVDDIGYA